MARRRKIRKVERKPRYEEAGLRVVWEVVDFGGVQVTCYRDGEPEFPGGHALFTCRVGLEYLEKGRGSTILCVYGGTTDAILEVLG